MMNTQTRRRLSWGAATLALTAALLLPAQSSHAAVTAVVTGSAPSSVAAGQPFTASFSATTSGQPNNNNECQISNLSYAWSFTCSNGGVVNPSVNGATATAQVSGSAGQSYTITGTCIVSYDASAECGGASNAQGSASTTTQVEPESCTAE